MSSIAQLATPTFVAGPKDSLATKDVYGIKSSSPINSFSNPAKTGGTTSLMGMMGSIGIQAAVPLIMSKVTGKSIPVQPDVLARASTAVGSSLSTAMRSLPPGVNNTLTKALTVAGPALISISGIKAVVPGTKFPVVNALGGVLNGITNTKNTFQLNDKLSGINSSIGLVSANVKAGIPGTYLPIVNSIVPNDRALANAVATGSLKNINTFSDVTSLRQMANATTGSLLKSVNPSAISDSTKSFTKAPLPVNIPVTQPISATNLAAMTELKTTYGLIDPSWTATPTASGTVSNITPVVNGSKDLKDTFSSGALNSASSEDKAFLLAGMAGTGNATASVSSQFPTITFGEGGPRFGG
jgi:hypothetical protein